MAAHEAILELKDRMSESIIGQEAVVERLLLVLLANGNLLLEGLPGLAKTRAIKSMAKYMESKFSRIQFTPDLLTFRCHRYRNRLLRRRQRLL